MNPKVRAIMAPTWSDVAAIKRSIRRKCCFAYVAGVFSALAAYLIGGAL